jgi:hypothetical protein
MVNIENFHNYDGSDGQNCRTPLTFPAPRPSVTSPW